MLPSPTHHARHPSIFTLALLLSLLLHAAAGLHWYQAGSGEQPPLPTILHFNLLTPAPTTAVWPEPRQVEAVADSRPAPQRRDDRSRPTHTQPARPPADHAAVVSAAAATRTPPPSRIAEAAMEDAVDTDAIDTDTVDTKAPPRRVEALPAADLAPPAIQTQPPPPAAVAASAPATVPASMPPPFDTPSLRHHYLDALTSHIGAHKFYPLAARRRGVEGSVVIRFTLLAGGLVSDLECQGHKLLRSAACEAVNNSRPLPPPPAALQLPLAIEFSMRFTLSP